MTRPTVQRGHPTPDLAHALREAEGTPPTVSDEGYAPAPLTPSGAAETVLRMPGDAPVTVVLAPALSAREIAHGRAEELAGALRETALALTIALRADPVDRDHLEDLTLRARGIALSLDRLAISGKL